MLVPEYSSQGPPLMLYISVETPEGAPPELMVAEDGKFVNAKVPPNGDMIGIGKMARVGCAGEPLPPPLPTPLPLPLPEPVGGLDEADAGSFGSKPLLGV